MIVASENVMEIKNNAKMLFRLAGSYCQSCTEIEFFSWSDDALEVLASIFCGEPLERLELSQVIDKREIVHLVYYYYLRRLADAAAIDRLCVFEREGLVEYCRSAILRSEEYALHGRVEVTLNISTESKSKPRIYIDVSNTKVTQGRTGIQRVVRELSRELQLNEFEDFTCIAYLRTENTFKNVRLLNDEFVELENSEPVFFAQGDIYFDVDGSWGDPVPRWSLYQKLRLAGVRILNVHYDAAPIIFPMYSHPVTVLRYLEHFFAASYFSDKFLCISEAVKNDYIKLASQLQWRCIPTTVIPLGNVFSVLNTTSVPIPDDVLAFTKIRFLLLVGTVEPRKNYALLLHNLKHIQRLGLRVVLVGKKGWESPDIIQALEAAEYAGSILWLKNATDEVLKYLYETCYLYVSVAHYEGYGLPVLEALSYSCAVVTSDGGALEEVGRGYTLSFSLSDKFGLVNILDALNAEPERYTVLKEKAAHFQAPVWADTIASVREVVERYLPDPHVYIDWKSLQLVYISIRPESLQRSLLSFKKFGHTGAVTVLTSRKMKTHIESVLNEIGLTGVVLCDEDIFSGEEIPEDHQERNFQLRKRLYSNSAIEQIFLSLDDDAILLRSLPEDYYIRKGKYRAYYYYGSMSKWKASPFGITSYDEGQWRTAALLCAYNYNDKSFSAHQPQIIDKALVQEVYHEYANCVGGGVDEWSLYFNVCINRYSNRFCAQPVTTLNWPEDYASWMPGWFSDEVYFMNYYPGSEAINDHSKALSNYSAAYDKYYAQRLLGGIARSFILDNEAENLLVGLPGLWVDANVSAVISDVGYYIYQGDVLVVDGSRDIQSISPHSPLKVKMPDDVGEYSLRVFLVRQERELATASVLVFPWRF